MCITTMRSNLTVLKQSSVVSVEVVNNTTSVTNNSLPHRTIPVHEGPVTSLVQLNLLLIQEESRRPRTVHIRDQRNIPIICRECQAGKATIKLLSINELALLREQRKVSSPNTQRSEDNRDISTISTDIVYHGNHTALRKSSRSRVNNRLPQRDSRRVDVEQSASIRHDFA